MKLFKFYLISFLFLFSFVLVTPASADAPSGTLSATDCTILKDASTCVSKLNWTTSNLIPGVLWTGTNSVTVTGAEVTKNNPDSSVSYSTSGTDISNTIKYGNTTFYLYANNGVELKNAPVTATCATGTIWDTTAGICGGPPATVAKPDLTPGGVYNNYAGTNTFPPGCTSATAVSTAGVSCAGLIYVDSEYTFSSNVINQGADYITNAFNSHPLWVSLFQVASGPGGTGTISDRRDTYSSSFKADTTNQTIISELTILTTPLQLNYGASILPGQTDSVVTQYNFNSIGTHSMRVCADLPPYPNGVIDESNENNNCGPWTNINVISKPGVCFESPTKDTTVACDPKDGQELVSGSVIRRQTISAYPGCAYGESVYVSDNCVYKPSPSGTLSATDCKIITAGASTCVSKVTWKTSNLIAGIGAFVTRNNPDYHTALPLLTSSGTDVPDTINYGLSTYYLYYNIITGNEPPLATKSVTASCDATKNLTWDTTSKTCVSLGTWSYSTSCPTACGTNSSTQTQTCTGGNGSCSGTASSRICNATAVCLDKCPAPLTKTVTAQCDVNANGDAATSGSVTRRQTKSAYPQCTFGSPVTRDNSTYVSDNCVYPVVKKCPDPLTQTVTVQCDLKNGVSAISGSVTRRQTKSAYPECTFGSPVTTDNSTYVSDNCAYPISTFPVDGYWGNPTCSACDLINKTQTCTKICIPPKNGGANCLPNNGTGILKYTQSCAPTNLNIIFTANPSKIFKGRSSLLTWTSNATSCTAVSATGFGVFNTTNKANSDSLTPATVSPPTTTIYKISCTKGGITETAEATVKVDAIILKET